MATSKTVSSVSNSNKQNTNKESVSYLVAYKNETTGYIEDKEAFSVFNDVKSVNELYNHIYDTFDTTDMDQFVVLPFYNSEIKRFKQTLELV